MDLIRQYPSSDDSGSPESMTKKFDIHSSSLLTYLGDLLESGLDSDLKILCTMGGETKEINVHKLILSRIPHFKIMLEGKFAESQENQIIISDFEYDVIKEMIRYIYTTNVHNIRNLANKLLVAAEKYGIDPLKTKCEHHLSRAISEVNAGSMLMLAHTHGAVELERATMRYIDIHFPHVQRSNTPIINCLIQTLNVDDATEVLIFAFVNKWDDLIQATMEYIQEHFNEIEQSGGWKESFPKYLIDNINVKNAAELYIFSENTYTESLKKETAAFIQDHFDVVKATDGYNKLTHEQLETIVSLSSPSKRRKLNVPN